jgi:hypothetical protein
MLVRCYDTPLLKIGNVRYKRATDGKAAPAAYNPAAAFIIPTGSSAIAPVADDGDIEFPFDLGYGRDGQVTFLQDLPVGGTLIMTTAEVDVGR